VVFRRDNKVDSFQRQMSALRQQLGGNAEEELEDEMPEIDDDRYPAEREDTGSDSGAYSFGSYPAEPSQPRSYAVESDEPPVPEMPEVDDQISVVASGATWKGDVESDHSIHVYGRVEGTLTAREDIWIAQGAEVNATLSARRVIAAGTVGGSVTVTDRFEALAQGVISADVTAPTFVVHEGANINGQLRMGSGTSGETTAERSAVIQRRARPGA
jgi:cytoskeletal protein CcmA (bactofilin family)